MNGSGGKQAVRRERFSKLISIDDFKKSGCEKDAADDETNDDYEEILD